ncbi:hypothetical protein [Winogradskyella sediminis]|uniref:YD repeat-containing protein n=1 Tax=Winogradskyella sediminis TaxID=1382466 RepID=A0A1H1M064_9FLAO|nr:hypothetical protein [Winogradskyella sediminis]SDR79439.1 hypothetical protein SAMN04489797_0141 [Winogradskyella sediminis]
MKKLNLLLGILIGITILSCSSDDGNNDNPNESNLKRIKSLQIMENGSLVRQYDFEYENERLASLTEVGDERIVFSYSDDRIILAEEFNFTGSEYNQLDETTTYTFENGLLVSDLEEFIQGDGNRHQYDFNSNKQITEYAFFQCPNNLNDCTPAGSRIFEYSTNNNIITETQTDNNSNIVFSTEYSNYDDKNHPFAGIDIETRRLFWNYFQSMNFNNYSMLTRFDSNGTETGSSSFTFTYDNDDFPTEMIETNNTTNEQTVYIFIYE